MKKHILWALFIFMVVTLLTMRIDSPHDGVDKVGFPFVFYDNFTGKCSDCYKDYGLHPWHLVFDMGLVLMLTSIGIKAIKKKNNNH